MKTAPHVKNLVQRVAPAAIAAILLLAPGCGDSADQATETNSPAPAPANRSAVVPVPGAKPTGPAPEFTSRTPSVPTGGVSLEELHRQGKTEVVR